jgi:hypothetical protein
MTQKEHLKKIKAKCQKLLEIAEKRTAGAWNTQTLSYRVQTNEGGIGKYVAEMMTDTSHERDSDATFIASCAGAAEAGWRATIAAIDQILIARQDTICWDFFMKPLMETTIAAWPEEIL